MQFIENIQAERPVFIARDLVLKDFRGCSIVQDGGSFTLCREVGTSVSTFTISAEDALWIIDALGLDASLSIALRRVVYWRK